MAEFLIDANLPYRFLIWQGNEYIHQFELGDEWPDIKIWNYAKARNLTIVTKDTDFSDRIINVYTNQIHFLPPAPKGVK
jgi:predicted nuclease of predicted toxin-antitoxin system